MTYSSILLLIVCFAVLACNMKIVSDAISKLHREVQDLFDGKSDGCK